MPGTCSAGEEPEHDVTVAGDSHVKRAAVRRHVRLTAPAGRFDVASSRRRGRACSDPGRDLASPSMGCVWVLVLHVPQSGRSRR